MTQVSSNSCVGLRQEVARHVYGDVHLVRLELLIERQVLDMDDIHLVNIPDHERKEPVEEWCGTIPKK